MKKRFSIKKIILAGLSFSLLMGIATACDPLGIEPTNKVDENRFWENPQLARSYVNNFYFWSPAASGDTHQSEQWSDNCQGDYELGWNTYRQEIFNQRRYDENNEIGVFTAPWADSYKRIRLVNLGIEKISVSPHISALLKEQLLGECYFFRAFLYSDMIKYWGAVPYVDKALQIDDDTYIPQSKRELIFDNILSDLNKAITHFDAYKGSPAVGMVNKDVAIAYISRVGLYAANAADASVKGVHVADDAKGLFKFEKNSQHYYQIAYDAAKGLIGKYSLEPKYEDLFISQTSHLSPESIWPVMFKEAQRHGFNPTGKNGPDGTYYGGTQAVTHDWNFRSGTFPTQDLVDCYLQKDIVDGKWKKWWKTSQAQAMGIQRNAEGEISGESADYRKMFENRDSRFYATVTYDGSYMGPEEELYIIQTWIDATNPATSLKYSSLHTGYRYMDNMASAPTNRGSTQTITGYYSRKYSHFDRYNEDGTFNSGTQRQTSYFNIRYAEVLLNCAEAGIKLNKSDAKGYIDDIRVRAGLTKYEGSDLWEEMKIQRCLEFAFECPGFRYFDLLRWAESEGKSTIDELNKASRGLWIFRKGIESQVTGENGYPMDPSSAGYYTPKFQTFTMPYSYYLRVFNNARYYFAPFSTTTLKDYKQLQQNPGWTNFN